MNKIWYLSTCDTCKRIIKELNVHENNFHMQDVKIDNITPKQLETIKKTNNCSYEELFNKRAQKYTKTNLKEELKTDIDFKKAILEEYTFMKRPIIQIGEKYFVGNSKKVVEGAKEELNLE